MEISPFTSPANRLLADSLSIDALPSAKASPATAVIQQPAALLSRDQSNSELIPSFPPVEEELLGNSH
jgi:hypothetical protein